MEMQNYEYFVCKNAGEVKNATRRLDKAMLLPIAVEHQGVMKTVDNFKGIYNIDRQKYCASVVPYYNLITHEEYFNGFAEALDKLNVSYTMSIKQFGDRAFGDIEFTGRNIKFDTLDEEFTTGIRLINSYSKSHGILVSPLYKRLACSNGMVVTRQEKQLTLKHTSQKLKEIESFIETRLNEIIDGNEDLKMWVSQSMGDSIEWMLACKILEKLFNQPKHLEEILKRLDINLAWIEKKGKKGKVIVYGWNDEKKKKLKLSRWEIYNAITHYITHGEQISPHVEDYFQRKAERVLTTKLVDMKHRFIPNVEP